MASVPTTREQAHVWLAKLHDAHDSLDVSRIDDIYSQSATLQFGNVPLIQGIDAIKTHFAGSYLFSASMKHHLKEYEIVGERIWHTVEVTIRVKGDPRGDEVTFRAAAFATIVTQGVEAGKMDRYEIYADHTKLVEKLKSIAPGV